MRRVFGGIVLLLAVILFAVLTGAPPVAANHRSRAPCTDEVSGANPRDPQTGQIKMYFRNNCDYAVRVVLCIAHGGFNRFSVSVAPLSISQPIYVGIIDDDFNYYWSENGVDPCPVRHN